jgi:hypothetical protein
VSQREVKVAYYLQLEANAQVVRIISAEPFMSLPDKFMKLQNATAVTSRVQTNEVFGNHDIYYSKDIYSITNCKYNVPRHLATEPVALSRRMGRRGPKTWVYEAKKWHRELLSVIRG